MLPQPSLAPRDFGHLKLNSLNFRPTPPPAKCCRPISLRAAHGRTQRETRESKSDVGVPILPRGRQAGACGTSTTGKEGPEEEGAAASHAESSCARTPPSSPLATPPRDVFPRMSRLLLAANTPELLATTRSTTQRPVFGVFGVLPGRCAGHFLPWNEWKKEAAKEAEENTATAWGGSGGRRVTGTYRPVRPATGVGADVAEVEGGRGHGRT